MEQTPSQESQLFWEKDLARADLDVRIVVYSNPLPTIPFSTVGQDTATFEFLLRRPNDSLIDDL